MAQWLVRKTLDQKYTDLCRTDRLTFFSHAPPSFSGFPNIPGEHTIIIHPKNARAEWNGISREGWVPLAQKVESSGPSQYIQVVFLGKHLSQCLSTRRDQSLNKLLLK